LQIHCESTVNPLWIHCKSIAGRRGWTG
jgi:hypothetical protein